MSVAYVDTSVVVSIAFVERGGAAFARRLAGFDELVSSNLLEAELRAAFSREDVDFDPAAMTGIGWVIPDRSLGREFAAALAAGHLRGADLWHIACALFLSPDPGELTFVTADARQREIAKGLGLLV